MNDNNDQELLTPLRDLTIEITQKYVSQIVKESTKQAIRKQGVKLSKSQFHKFEDKIKNLSDKEKIEELKEPLEEVKQTITGEGINEENLVKISDTIHKGFDIKIALGMSLGVKAGILTAFFVVGFVSTALFLFPGSGEQLASTLSTATGMGGDDNTIRKICPECNGIGTITYEVEQPRTCPICMGTGELVGGICDKCDGTGIWGTELVNKTDECTECKGDGYLDPGDPGYS